MNNIKKIIAIVLALLLLEIPAVFAATVINSEAGVTSALAAGGDYVLGTDNILIGQRGLESGVVTSGTLDGAGYTLLRKTNTLGDAMLYCNSAGTWTFKNMTLDGNKANATHSDACLWYMAGTTTFENVTVQNFKGSNAGRPAMTVFNSARVILDNVLFKDNESTSDSTPFTFGNGSVDITTGTWGGSPTVTLRGNTQANIYYTTGVIDVSDLTNDGLVTVKANNAANFNIINALAIGPSVTKTADAAANTVVFGEGTVTAAPWTIDGEKTYDDGSNTTAVSVSVKNNTPEIDQAVVIAESSLYNGTPLETKESLAAVAFRETQTLAFDFSGEDIVIKVRVVDKDTREPLSDVYEVTKEVFADPPEEPLPVGCVYRYDFDHNLDTTTPLLGGNAKIGNGVVGDGLDNTASGSHMTLPADATQTDEFSFLAWINPASLGNYARLFDFGTGQSDYFYFSPVIDSNNGRIESIIGGITDTLSFPAIRTTGQWMHVAVTRSVSEVTLYVNGELYASGTCRVSLNNMGTSAHSLGQSKFSWDPTYRATYDNVELYHKICTAEEIRDTYQKYASQLNAGNALKDYNWLTLKTQYTESVQLPTVGKYNSTITWSDNGKGVLDNGSLVMPGLGEADVQATLTATVTNGNDVYTKDFDVVLIAQVSVTDLEEYAMSEIDLTDPYLVNANDKMVSYLKEFDMKRLAARFYYTSHGAANDIYKNISTYGGWETNLIAGHTTGHYLSAIAQAYESSGKTDTELSAKITELIGYLDEAQVKEDAVVVDEFGDEYTVKKGFLFVSLYNGQMWSFPVFGEQQFDNQMIGRTGIGDGAWVPWYTMHKLLQGLVDVYKVTGDAKALEIASGIGSWTFNRVGNYTNAQQNTLLSMEYGGMNDCLYELYKITRNPDHAKAAHMFDENTLFNNLYNNNDVLSGKHANTMIPKFVGGLNRYLAYLEVGEQMLIDSPDRFGHDIDFYLTMAENFWDTVINNHSYITGGNSQGEHFRNPNMQNSNRTTNTCETCNSFNMLKLTRGLFQVTGNKKYLDFYENTFLNAIVSSQNPETGMTMYFQPMATGYFKVYSRKWQNFYCCTGTGLESLSKLSDSLYYQTENAIVFGQYVSSVLRDRAKGITLTVDSDLLTGGGVTISVNTEDAAPNATKLMLRLPDWAMGYAVKLNGEAYDTETVGGFILLDRAWADGDVIAVDFGIEVVPHGLPDSDTLTAFKYGPVVLSAQLGTDRVIPIDEENNTYNNWTESEGMSVRKPLAGSTVINEYITVDPNYGTREEWLANATENLVKDADSMSFTMTNTDTPLTFIPHYQMHGQRYGIYWYLDTADDDALRDYILESKEIGRDINIITDSIQLAHDQQENGHHWIGENTIGFEGSGVENSNYRQVLAGGALEFQMAVNKRTANYLRLMMDPADAGKSVSVYVGGELIDIVDYDGEEKIIMIEIPDAIIQEHAYVAGSDAATIVGKDAVVVAFKADQGTDAPKLYGVVQMIRDYGANASLSDLRFDEGTLTPAFDADIQRYTLYISEETDAAHMLVTLAEQYGLVYVDGVLINDALETNVSLYDGATIKVRAKAEDHYTQKTYTIDVVVGELIEIFATNPIIQTTYTADPAPIVYGDTVYLYTGNDLETATTSYKMTDYKCYSSKDMVNWTDHGTVLDVTAFSWARHDQDANASHVIYNPKTDKFYYFVSVSCTLPGRGGIALGVAGADSPTGPFVDAIGAPLVTNDQTKYGTHSWDDLDPAVFIDDDGTAYVVWGNNACYWATLNDEMTALTSPISYYDIADQAQFGPDFEEAPWLYKREGIYYLVYASKFPETISYSTSDSPEGPWTFGGEIMGRPGSNCSTIHPGIIDFKGESYFFYHKNGLPGGGDYKRAVCVEKFIYGEDGSIPLMAMTDTGGVTLLETLNPYERTEAETIAWSYPLLGVGTERAGLNLTALDDGDYVRVAGLDFGNAGAGAFIANIASAAAGGSIELRLDSADGALIGALPVPNTGGMDIWVEKATSVSGATGVHDLYLVFDGIASDSLKVDYWRFLEKTDAKELGFLDVVVDRVEIDKNEAVGITTAEMTVTAYYTDGTNADVTEEAIAEASVDGIVSISGGTVTGVGYGETDITVSFGGMTRTFSIAVVDLAARLTPGGIALSRDEMALFVGRDQALTVTATYLDGHTEDVTSSAEYAYSVPGIASVSDGKVSAIAVGTTEITVTFTGLIGTPVTAKLTVIVTEKATDMEVWYKFDETSGTVAYDSSGNGYDAEMMNGASFTGESASLAGSTSTGSGGQYVNLPRNILENVPSDFTVSTWVKNRAAGQQQWIRVFDFGPGSSSNIMFLTARDFQFNMDNANAFSAPTASRPNNNINEWLHVTVTHEGNTTRMYVNGEQVATNNQPSNAQRVPATGGFYIGRSNWADQYANMEIKDFRIYNRALNADEVNELYMPQEEGVNFTYDGEAAEALIPGETLDVSALIEISGDTAVTMYAALYDNDGRLIDVSSATGTVSDGKLSFNVGIDIPESIEDGASVKIFFWETASSVPVRPATEF